MSSANDAAASSSSDDDVLESWRLLYDWLYGAAEGDELIGWQDSFSGDRIPDDVMRQWRDVTVQEILRLRPRDVLEIGCGTGMILGGVAGDCHSYVATDLSDEAVGFCRRRYATTFPHLTLHRMPAHEAVTFAREVDLVVLNSVVQYFPDQDYLESVLVGIVETLPVGGAVFVGDVLDLRLADVLAYHRHRDAPARPDAGSRRELFVAPDFFYELADACDGDVRVHLRLKRGAAWSEMNAYRYDVVLERAQPCGPHELAELTYGVELTDLAAIRDIGAGLVLRDVPNARLVEHLRDLGAPQDPRRFHANANPVDPDEAWRWARSLSELATVAPADTVGRFDVVLPAQECTCDFYRRRRISDGPTTGLR